MHIAIVGAGGVGGYFGARLAAAGTRVSFIARGDHLAALRQSGLKIESELGDFTLAPVEASAEPAGIGPVDLVIIAVKLWSTAGAVAAARPLMGGDSAIVSLQNGVEARDILADAFGPGRVLGGVAHIAAAIAAPGVIRHSGTLARLTLGEFDRRRSARVEALHAACVGAGIDAMVSDDIGRAIWEKFVFLVGLSGMTSLTRLPIGPVRADPETRALLRATFEETAAVGRARGVDLGADLVDRQLALGDSLPETMISSMLGDLQRGNRLELPWLSGAVARMGEEAGVATPVNRFIHGALKLHAAGR